MNIELKIDPQCKEIKVIIISNENNKEVDDVINRIKKESKVISGIKNGNLFLTNRYSFFYGVFNILFIKCK